ncbi:hypothetical protein ACNO6Y_26350, partial [Vibrio owensii]
VTVDENGNFSVTVPAGHTGFTVIVPTLNDDVYEGNESFTLSGATSSQATPAVGTGTIADEGANGGND